MVKINWNKFITDFENSKPDSSVVNRSKGSEFRFIKDVSAKEITTMATGGEVSMLCEVQNRTALELLIAFCRKRQVPVLFLGNGSNIVISDQGIEGQLVIKYVSKEKFEELPLTTDDLACLKIPSENSQSDQKSFRVHASQSMIGLSRQFSAEGLSGFEFAAGIPGTVGGALRMNAGAHGNTFSEIVVSVEAITDEGTLKQFSRNELEFEYRKVSLPKSYFILSVDIVLFKNEISKVVEKRKNALNYRKKTQPLTQPSSGSVFKNPSPEKSAGLLLERVGLKGFRYGGVEFSQLHSNWIVKVDESAKSSDVKYLVELGKEKVLKAYGIELKEEIIFWE